jgi:NADH-quinone oxidoreductase subunit J
MTPLQVIFLIVAGLALVSAFLVVAARNLIHSALWLIVTLFAVAMLFVLLEAAFLAVVQVVLYIGAIAILIIFALMLTRGAMQESTHQTRSGWWATALLAAVVFAGLAWITTQIPGFASASTVAFDEARNIQQLGLDLVNPNRFMLPFEVASVLLLAALVGSVIIAGERK